MPNRHIETRSHCLVTVPCNALIEPYNDRMPALLAEPYQTKWLDPTTEPSEALALLKPCPCEWLEIKEVIEESRRKKSKYLDLFDGE